MNPKLKTALAVVAVAVAFVSGTMLGVWVISYYLADTVNRRIDSVGDQAVTTPVPKLEPPISVTPGLPILPAFFVSAILFIVGWWMIARFEYSNKTVKTTGFVIFLFGCAGFLLTMIMAAISR